MHTFSGMFIAVAIVLWNFVSRWLAALPGPELDFGYLKGGKNVGNNMQACACNSL